MSAARLLLLSCLCACGAPHYPLNIEPDPSMGARLKAVVSTVRPMEGAVEEESWAAHALVNWIEALEAPPSPKGRALKGRIDAGEILAFAYPHAHEGETVYHEVAAGLIPLGEGSGDPFARFIQRFKPASSWGRGLWGYEGGAFTADGGGRARERMVLGTPWYAWGAPDLDMSKHELAVREADRSTISWIVTASENGSVHLDIGYVRFQRYASPLGPAALVLFNSIHRTEPGWMGEHLLWEGATRAITLEVLRDMFAGHIERYREIYARQEETGA